MPKPRSWPEAGGDLCTACPIAIKDLFDTAGLRTTAASNQFRERIPAANSEMVQLLNAAGERFLLGKLNLHEFAFGVSGVGLPLVLYQKSMEPGAHLRRLVLGFWQLRLPVVYVRRRSERTRQGRFVVLRLYAELWGFAPAPICWARAEPFPWLRRSILRVPWPAYRG